MDDFLWVEQYRPKTISDTILPPKLKKVFQAVVDSGKMPNMLFTGTAGLGKTTVARAICNEMGLDYIVINCSDERGIDTLRKKIKTFASSVSMGGGIKVVILDEADYATGDFQAALRGFIEHFSNNCRFILTCNFKNRLIPALHSRCSVYEFNTTRKEMASLAAQFHKRAMAILDENNVTYDAKVVAGVILSHAPDWRRILSELQRIAMTGEVTTSTVVEDATKFEDLFKFLKDKDFKKMRTWVVHNMDTDTVGIIRGIYDEAFKYVQPSSTPTLILILADYQYKAAFVADHEINMVACMTELMSNVEFI